MIRMFSAAALVLTLVGFVTAAPVTYPLTGDNTTVTFIGTKPDGKHTGGFKKVVGDVVVDGDITTAKLSVDIDVDSMYTDDAKLTAHLKSPDFFDVKEYPKAKFVSTKITKLDKGYQVAGNLTLHGQTKPFNFPAEITATPEGFTLTSAFRMNRQDFGISYGKGKIDDEVTVSIKVNAKK